MQRDFSAVSRAPNFPWMGEFFNATRIFIAEIYQATLRYPGAVCPPAWSELQRQCRSDVATAGVFPGSYPCRRSLPASGTVGGACRPEPCWRHRISHISPTKAATGDARGFMASVGGRQRREAVPVVDGKAVKTGKASSSGSRSVPPAARVQARGLASRGRSASSARARYGRWAVNGLQEKFRDTGARLVSRFSKRFHLNSCSRVPLMR